MLLAMPHRPAHDDIDSTAATPARGWTPARWWLLLVVIVVLGAYAGAVSWVARYVEADIGTILQPLPVLQPAAPDDAAL